MITVTTKAKLNLTLRIVGRRADGYHLLHSVVAFCDVGDVLHVQPAADLKMQITGRFLDGLSVSDNSVMHAARLLQAHSGVTQGAMIRLEKRLPLASGIGGGSGDAAAALLALNALWECGLNANELMQLALPVGADVPVCIHGKYCIMEGIGERITSLPPLQHEYYAVLVNPLIAVSTPAIFKALAWEQDKVESSPTGRGQGEGILQREGGLTWLHYLRTHQNDLQEVAIQHYPIIEDILNALNAHSATLLARLSGSGATCFALCESKGDAEQIMQAMQRAFPDFWMAYGKIT